MSTVPPSLFSLIQSTLGRFPESKQHVIEMSLKGSGVRDTVIGLFVNCYECGLSMYSHAIQI
jgi:hypothetical protein